MFRSSLLFELFVLSLSHQNNSCFINRYCFAPNETNPTDWCYQCLPEVSTNSWTKRQGDYKHIIIMIIIIEKKKESGLPGKYMFPLFQHSRFPLLRQSISFQNECFEYVRTQHCFLYKSEGKEVITSGTNEKKKKME